MPETAPANSINGQTLLWKFEGGPTAGSTYEHAFQSDGSVVFRKLEGGEGAAKGSGTRVKRYGSFEVAPDVHLVSYLEENSGYTLTVALNFKNKRMYGFASNNKEWYPVTGTFEIAK